MTIFTENIEYEEVSYELPDNLAFQVDGQFLPDFNIDLKSNVFDAFIKNILQEKTGMLVKSCDWYIVK